MKTALLLTLAAALALPACKSVDESAPTSPRLAPGGGVLAPTGSDIDNANKRVLEAPKQQIPASGAEYPGQSQAPALSTKHLALSTPSEPRVLTAGNFYTTPDTNYYNDTITGDVPHLPEKPATHYMTGTEAVPDTPWLIDNSWGQVLPLQNVAHRAWPETQTHYYSANIKNNPIYYFNLQEHLNVPQNDGTYKGDMISTAIETPWFLATTAALPVLMVLDPPLAQRTTDQGSFDPNYRGYLSAQGDIVPSPQPGIITFEYSFLKKSDTPPASEPAGAPIPGLDVPANTTSTSLPAIIPVPDTNPPTPATNATTPPPATQP